MKKNLALIVLLLQSFILSLPSSAQTPGEWTWMKGDSLTGSPGVFGTKGVPAPSNSPPSLYEAGEWTDLQGNFWIYGGLSSPSFSVHGDLWKYDVSLNMWTWVNGSGTTGSPAVYGLKGVAAATNYPGSRTFGMFTWTDIAGDLWLWGGYGNNKFKNDLWKYHISSNMWTWVSGDSSGNSPGAYGIKGIPSVNNAPASRAENASAWTDNAGNLWLFGGQGNNGADLNDLWRYNISTNEWTWMAGSSGAGVLPVYGTKGVSAPGNDPGARWSYSHWKDKAGNLWLFGGRVGNGVPNDMWKYDIGTGEWTWMSGSSAASNWGFYSAHCDTNSSEVPGGHMENRACWTDSCGNFWLMGGLQSIQNVGWSDLWQYNPVTGQWRWINGSDTLAEKAIYGTLGVSSPTNLPGNRAGGNGGIDNNGNLWLFGGWQYNMVPAKTMNDLWRYVPDPSCGGCTLAALPVANFISSDTSFCDEGGKCINFTDHSTGNPTSWKWLFPGAVPNNSNQQNPTNICYNTPGTFPVTLIVTNSAGTDTLTVSPMIMVGGTPPAPTLTLSHDTVFCSPAVYYQWYYNGNIIPGATGSFYVAVNDGTYNVQITDSLGCSRLGNGILFVGMNEFGMEGGFIVFPNPAGSELSVQCPQCKGKDVIVEIYNVLGEKVFSQISVLNTQHFAMDFSSFAKGVYVVQVNDGVKVYRTKFIKD